MRTALVTLMMCLLALPVNAKYSGGTGEPNDPYQIATAADLIALGETPEDYDKHFILTADIDLDPNLPGRKVFDDAVISTLTGVFDGKGYTISHLTTSLFARLESGAKVMDLGVVDVNIAGGSRGGLVGSNGGLVIQCYSTGAVSGAGDQVGGLVGYSSGTVTQCYASGTVSGSSHVGGLIGDNSGIVIRCHSTGAVSGTGRHVGGLVGNNTGFVTQCYCGGTVRGTEYVGGLVGNNEGPWGFLVVSPND